ncbi:hypothetical protein [Oceanomicrobium pacificus]|uniref:Uncharacterized protein n=1 Tax=Oceanomicrobium pacificus TaxID=2692916 RepID=A0A6B0TLM9_9RHOB|nr:hypothetical protein [Oceanomicrobium pacificus]MXU65427.1 hypothetical protein [Oceanomicrobium pacificus]
MILRLLFVILVIVTAAAWFLDRRAFRATFIGIALAPAAVFIGAALYENWGVDDLGYLFWNLLKQSLVWIGPVLVWGALLDRFKARTGAGQGDA